jgi:hypothetical protein
MGSETPRHFSVHAQRLEQTQVRRFPFFSVAELGSEWFDT